MLQSSSEEKVSSISNHLRDPSFKSFISWEDDTCTISSINLFTVLSLETFRSDYTFKDFIRHLKDWNVKFRLTTRQLKVKFPKISKNNRKRSRSNNRVLDKLNQIEEKQEDLMKLLERTREKFQRAVAIHSKINMEIRKSKERQVKLFQGCEKEEVIMRCLGI